MENLFNSEEYFERIKLSAGRLIEKLGESIPNVVIQCGSAGPKGIIEILKKQGKLLEEISFTDVDFPAVGVGGHEPKIIPFSLSADRGTKTRKVLVVCGRHHFYQSGDVYKATYASRVFAEMGVKNLVLLNAAGGLSDTVRPGSIIAITSGNTSIPSPNIGVMFNQIPFLDPKSVFDFEWCVRARRQRTEKPFEFGSYFAKQGPEYESIEEAKFLRSSGYDAGGMSTVPEAWAAKAQSKSMNIVGLSLITNHHFHETSETLSHEEVIQMSEKNDAKLSDAVWALIQTCAM